MSDLELQNKYVKKNLEEIALSLGLPEKYVHTLIKISTRKELMLETISAIKIHQNEYRNKLHFHKRLFEDPSKFYQENKKIISTEKKLITFGSLSLSYSFSSLYGLLRDIISESKIIHDFVEFMKETSDKNYTLEMIAEDEAFFINVYQESQVKKKYLALKQDLRGNKISDYIINDLLGKLKFDKRPIIRDGWGLSGITQESIIDSMYIFFGSERGTEFIKEYEIKQNKNKLLNEFEFLMYNNPYINPLLIDESLQTYMSNGFIESAEKYLERNKNSDNRNNNREINFMFDK